MKLKDEDLKELAKLVDKGYSYRKLSPNKILMNTILE